MGLREAVRKLFFPEVYEKAKQGGEVKVEVQCLLCAVPLIPGEVTAPISEEEVGVVLQALLCSPPEDRNEIQCNFLLCGECGISLTTLADLFLQLEDLRRKFNDLRRRVGHQVIVDRLGESEERWKAWEGEVSALEEIFPSCVKGTSGEEGGIAAAALLSMNLKEEPTDDFGGGESDPGEYMLEPVEGTCLEHDIKLENLTPKVRLQRITPTEEHRVERNVVELGGSWEETELSNFESEGTSEEEHDEIPSSRLLRKRHSQSSKKKVDFKEEDSSSAEDNFSSTPSKKTRFTNKLTSKDDVASFAKKPFKNRKPQSSEPPKKKYTRHPCTLCSRIFARSEGLRRHQTTVHSLFSEEKLPCSHCEQTFPDSTTLKSHKMRRHFVSSITDPNCPYCLKVFPNEKKLKEHKKKIHFQGQQPLEEEGAECGSAHSPQNIKCFLCNKSPSYLTSEELATHAKSSEHEAKIRWKTSVHCNVCCTNFQGDIDALQLHLKSPQHLEEVKSLENIDKSNFCVPCRTNFDTPRELLNHNTTFAHEKACRFRENSFPAETPLQVPVKCQSCPKTFDLQSSLDKHVLTFHTASEYTCEFCGASFSHKGDFQHHRLSHSNQIPKEAICEKCGKTFELRSNLLRHMKFAHEGEASTCEKCGKTFPTPTSLKQHLKNVHLTGSGKDEDFYASVCPHCPSSFKFLRALRKHLHETHPEEYLKDNKEACQVCFHVFLCGEELEGHMASHAHLQCQTCGRYFLTRHNLEIHVRSHTGEKPFECPYCERKYAWKRSLTEHIAEKHSQLTQSVIQLKPRGSQKKKKSETT